MTKSHLGPSPLAEQSSAAGDAALAVSRGWFPADVRQPPAAGSITRATIDDTIMIRRFGAPVVSEWESGVRPFLYCPSLPKAFSRDLGNGLGKLGSTDIPPNSSPRGSKHFGDLRDVHKVELRHAVRLTAEPTPSVCCHVK